MPRGSKKRKAAKKKQENRPNNHSSASTRSHGDEEGVKHPDERPSDVVPVEREFTFGEGENSNGISEPTGKSQNGGSSSSSNSSDEEVNGTENNSLPAEDISHAAGSVKAVDGVRVEEVETIMSDDSEKTPLLVGRVKSESLLEGDENKLSHVGNNVGTSEVRNEEGIVQSDNQSITEREKRHGEVVVDCLKYFRGPEDRYEEEETGTLPWKDLNREGSLKNVKVALIHQGLRSVARTCVLIFFRVDFCGGYIV